MGVFPMAVFAHFSSYISPSPKLSPKGSYAVQKIQ
jgi:hypothetical protein